MNFSFRFVSLLSHTSSSLAAPCDEGWLYSGGKCYYLNDEPLTWQQSDDYCQSQSRQSSLVSITNRDVQQVLYGTRPASVVTSLFLLNCCCCFCMLVYVFVLVQIWCAHLCGSATMILTLKELSSGAVKAPASSRCDFTVLHRYTCTYT